MLGARRHFAALAPTSQAGMTLICPAAIRWYSLAHDIASCAVASTTRAAPGTLTPRDDRRRLRRLPQPHLNT